MMISSALNLASSFAVILVTRMVLTATGCIPRSVAWKTVPNLRVVGVRSEVEGQRSFW